MDTMPMKRFYTKRYYPQREGERIAVDGGIVIARLKDGNSRDINKATEMEGCERCCFAMRFGCGLLAENLGCFDIRNDRRYYFEKEQHNGEEEVDRREEAESV